MNLDTRSIPSPAPVLLDGVVASTGGHGTPSSPSHLRMDRFTPEQHAAAIASLDEDIARLDGQLRVLRRARAILVKRATQAAEVSAPEDGGRWEDDGGPASSAHLSQD